MDVDGEATQYACDAANRYRFLATDSGDAPSDLLLHGHHAICQGRQRIAQSDLDRI
jgi:hypothetical protein